MVFSSLSFLFVFLPAVLLAHALVPKAGRNAVLLLASVVFYAWGEPRYLPLLAGVVAVAYGSGLLLGHVRSPAARKAVTAVSVAGILGVLGYFKYFNFLVANLNALTGAGLDFVRVLLPLGISFYTFQAVTYVVDVARGDAPVERNPFRFALYVLLFPKLIVGPIVQYRDVCGQLHARDVRAEDFVCGLQRLVVGLAKKMLVATPLGAIADRVFDLPPDALTCGAAWLGAAAYSLQLFYDFGGYSDMALGLGRMFGFSFKENFDHPYVSKSITEFWRRWHISLGAWFRDYLYIPLGGNRVSSARTVLNLAIVFLATGIWHGAAWTFVAWGCWHGLFVIAERLTGWHRREGGPLLALAHHAYALLAIVFGWVLFRAETFTQAGTFFRAMTGFASASAALPPTVMDFTPVDAAAAVAALVCATPACAGMLSVARTSGLRGWLVNAWLLLLFNLSVVQIVSSTYNPFIYFRF